MISFVDRLTIVLPIKLPEQIMVDPAGFEPASPKDLIILKCSIYLRHAVVSAYLADQFES